MRPTISRRRRPMVLLLLIVCLASGVTTASAQTMVEHAQSLGGVPADAAFYAAWVKNREQIETLQATNAWKKLMAVPVLQMGWMQVQTQWQYPTNPELIEFKNWFEGDEGQDAYNLMLEMMSDEVFVFGDSSVTAMLELMVEMNSEVTRAQFNELRETGNPDVLEDEQTLKEKMKELLDKYGDDLKMPNLVMGFRIEDQGRAIRMLETVATGLRDLIDSDEEIPAWVAESLTREQVDDHQLLAFTVKGEMLPWDELEEEMADDPEMFNTIKQLAEDKQMVLSVGVVGQFVVLAISDSLEIFENIAEGDLLADTNKFKHLDQHSSQKVVAIAYASEQFMQAVGSQQRSFGDIAVMLKGLLSMTDLNSEQIEMVENDLDDLLEDMLDYLPEPGALAAVSLLTERGYEAFSYNWGEMPPTVDASQPLTLIDHVGEDSLGWIVARGKQSIEGYDEFVGWCRRGFEHFEEIAEDQASPSDWEDYETVRDIVLPLLEQIDQANREYLIPGFKEGQTALVLDASLVDREWCDFMSPATQPLPLPSIAMVSGVSDAEAVKEGAAAYFNVAQQLIDELHKEMPDDVPAFQIPMPTVSATSVGDIYSYALPAEWGASERIAPNAGLSDSVLVLSLMPELTEQMMAGARPSLDGPVANFDRPLASAAHFKFAKLIDLANPWVDYAIQVAIEQAGDEGGGAVAAIGFVKPQVDQVLEVLKVIDSYTGVTYQEDGIWVTHGELRLIDLED